MNLKYMFATTAILILGACENPEPAQVSSDTEPNLVEVTKPEAMEEVETRKRPKAILREVLKSQPEDVQRRFSQRHPARTIEFLGIKPGMTVVEALPGGGWYSKILIPYLGSDGRLIGGQYPNELWPLFGFGEEWVNERIASSSGWTQTATDWGIEGASLSSTSLTDMPAELVGQVDAVLFIRALHNLSRFNDDGAFLDQSIAEAYRVLKPGGIVGVVQHRAPEESPNDGAKGQRGYLKTSIVIAQFEAAGFVLDGDSEINANPKDEPGADKIVWRLRPSLNGTEEGTPEREAMQAIGESDRMTLKFKKPAS